MDPSKFFRDGIISADGTFNYCYNISLKNVASVRIVRKLWMNEKEWLMKGYRKHRAFGQNDGWKDLEDCVLAKIKQLPLPQMTINQLLCVVEFVGNEIRNWINFQVYNVLKAGSLVECGSDDYELTNIFIHNMDCLEWAHDGKIDALKTATSLLKGTELNDEQKYVLSCVYCLEERLKNFPPEVIDKYLKACVRGKLDIGAAPMVYYWTNQLTNNPVIVIDITGDENDISTIEELVLNEICGYLDLCQEVACKFLWNKLTDTRKSNKLLQAMRGRASPFKYWLISSSNYQQQKKFFQTHYVIEFMIGMLCDWNFTDCFLPTCYHILDDLNINRYSCLFNLISREIGNCYKQGDKFCKVKYYEAILQTLWKNTPITLQKQFCEREPSTVRIWFE